MTGPRIAVLDGGLHHRGVFAGEAPTFLPTTRTAALRPERFDIVVVPFHTDQVFLGERREELESYVDGGGILLVLGACDNASTDWIPFCQWTPDFTRETVVSANSPTAKKAFAGVDSPQFHTHWHAHGALIPSRPDASEILATGEQSRPVMVLVRTPAGGAAIISTLDPDHHSSPTVPGGRKKGTESARQNALRLLHNLLAISKSFASAREQSTAWSIPEPKRVFLSHKSSNKQMVRGYKAALTELGFDIWLDEDALTAGSELERGLLKGMKESCGAVFFVTPEFKDEKWLAKEIDYAIAEKNARNDGFALVTVVFSDQTGQKGVVPELLRNRYVYKEPRSDLEALVEIVRALPVRPGPTIWRPVR